MSSLLRYPFEYITLPIPRRYFKDPTVYIFTPPLIPRRLENISCTVRAADRFGTAVRFVISGMSAAELPISNLPLTCRYFFRVLIGPEALQLAAAVTLYFPGLMQARRLRLHHRHRQLSTRCTGNQEQTIPDGHDRSVFRRLSQVDSGLESLAAIQGRDKKHCYFQGSRSAA
jgi:hypothetical protein